MLSLRRSTWLWLGVAVWGFAWSAHAQDIDLDRVCRELVDKGRDSYKDLGVPPQVSPILTEKYKGKAGDQVIRLLAKKHSSDTAIDAYVKLQLLTFEPDFKKAASEDIEKILKALPGLDRLPTPPSGLHRLEKMSWKQPLPKAGLEKATAAYNVKVGEVHSRNQRSLEYRKKLLQQLPSEGGYKLLGLLINHADVGAAGEEMPIKKKWQDGKHVPLEPTYDVAHAADEAGKVGAIEADMKRKIIAAMNQLMRIKGRYQSVSRTGVYEKDGKHHIWMHWRKTDKVMGENDAYYKQIKTALGD